MAWIFQLCISSAFWQLFHQQGRNVGQLEDLGMSDVQNLWQRGRPRAWSADVSGMVSPDVQLSYVIHMLTRMVCCSCLLDLTNQ